MSYCRFLEADVYVFFSVGDYLDCCGCSLAPACRDHPDEHDQSTVEIDEDAEGLFKLLGAVKCATCKGPVGHFPGAYSTQDMVDHLRAHQARGDYVPEHVFDDLWADDERNFPPMGKSREQSP